MKVDDKRAECNPDMFSAGVYHWNDNDEMDELMLFLATYCRNMHSDRYFKNELTLNPAGVTYLDIITPSDIAYTCSFIKNSSHVWTEKMSDDGVPADKAKKPLFTSGKGNKRTFGVTTWNSEGTKYFEEAMTNWMGA